MSTQGLINRYARAFIRGALAGGCDRTALCRAVGLAPDRDLDAPGDFDAETLARISREVKLLMQDEFCGLTATRCKIGAFGLMCELIVASATLEEALHKGFRFYAVLSDAIHFELQARDNVALVQMQLARPELDRDHFLYEWWFLNWRAIASWLIGEQVPFLSVALPHHPVVPFEDYVQVFSQECRFAQPAAYFTFERKYLAKRVIRTAASLSEFTSNQRIDLVSIPGVENNLKARVKIRLQQQFGASQSFPSMEEIAAQHYMSSQTLRRHLEEDGTSFRALKEDIRREVVMKALGDAGISIGEVSRLGGFAEPNGLTRAVKAWIGLSPKVYRDSIGRA
jgi:AraC-like DNA-binding protein